MKAMVQFLSSVTICFVVHFTALSVDMCYYVMSLAGLMNGELEIFGRKLCWHNRVTSAKENHDNRRDGRSCFWHRPVGFSFAWNRTTLSQVPAHIPITVPSTLSLSISTILNANSICDNK
jgi:hypothetical protein